MNHVHNVQEWSDRGPPLSQNNPHCKDVELAISFHILKILIINIISVIILLVLITTIIKISFVISISKIIGSSTTLLLLFPLKGYSSNTFFSNDDEMFTNNDKVDDVDNCTPKLDSLSNIITGRKNSHI